jgi:ribosome biogenesis GTPase
MDKFNLGWRDIWSQYDDAYQAGRLVRILARYKGVYKARANFGEVNCYLPGKIKRESSAGNLPAVGDWCGTSEPFIDKTNNNGVIVEEILPRKSKISRHTAGNRSEEQVLAANVDYSFIVTSANSDLNINRIERYRFISVSGNATPVIVVSKSDLPSDIGAIEDRLAEAFPDTIILTTSVLEGNGPEEIKNLLLRGKTGVFLGSSGVGKSSLINALLGREVQKTLTIREKDDKGRHATTTTSLFFIEEGGMVIDTPGLRELQVLGDTEQLEDAFTDIAKFSSVCRFPDCSHTAEPGCAVLAAIESGELDARKFANFLKLKKELDYSSRKLDKRKSSNAKKRWQKINIEQRDRYRFKGKNR